MEAYGFKERDELKKYRKVGSKKASPNFCDWENSVLENYRYIEDLSYFKNLKADLNKRCSFCEYNCETIKSIWIPIMSIIVAFALALPSLFIGFMQNQDSLQSEINSAYLEALKSDEVDVFNEQVELYQERLNLSSMSIDYATSILLITYMLVVVISFLFAFMLREKLLKISFYKDYITVLNKAIEAKNKVLIYV